MTRLLIIASTCLVLAACAGPQRPQLKVLGVEQSQRAYDGGQIKLFVEVTNYAKRPMHLQRLEYRFGPAGSHGEEARGSVRLSRTIEAGSAVVVEVPIIVDPDLLTVENLELRGELITEQDQVYRAYPVKSDIPE